MFGRINQNAYESLKKDVKKHEDNLKYLKSQANLLDELMLDLQVRLVNCHSTNTPKAANKNGGFHDSEEETTKNILKQKISAAATLCQLKSHQSFQLSYLPLTKDVIGVVATLARVHNDNFSRLLSESLGLENMLAIVCRTLEGVKALEKYCMALDLLSGGKLMVNFSSFVLKSGFIAGDPENKLALLKPKLPNGMCPIGFVDYAVDMINLDNGNLFHVRADGDGLREALFYALFSHLQIYTTRNEMLRALPCVTYGALSLDGGMIRRNGIFTLGNKNDINVKFPVIFSKCNFPANYSIEERIWMLKWDQLNIAEDKRREESLLDKSKIQLTSWGNLEQ